MLKRFLPVVSIFLALTLALSACAGGPPAAPTAKRPLRFGWSLYPGWYPLVIAEQQGLFKKYNVNVELVLFDEYQKTPPQLASGLVDGAALVLGDALLEDVSQYASIVAVTDNSHGADQLIASPEALAGGDLKGKRIGFSTGTFGELLVREMLKKYGLTFDDVIVVNTPPESVAEAIPESIDVGHTFEPFASQARAKGNIPIFTSADAPGVIVDTLVFTDAFIKERPDDVRNFLNAWFEAVDYWQKNPQAGSEIIAQATGQNVKDVSFQGIKFFNREANLATFQPGNNTKSVVFTAQMEMDFLISTGAITKPVDVGKILNPSFLK